MDNDLRACKLQNCKIAVLKRFASSMQRVSGWMKFSRLDPFLSTSRYTQCRPYYTYKIPTAVYITIISLFLKVKAIWTSRDHMQCHIRLRHLFIIIPFPAQWDLLVPYIKNWLIQSEKINNNHHNRSFNIVQWCNIESCEFFLVLIFLIFWTRVHKKPPKFWIRENTKNGFLRTLWCMVVNEMSIG